MARTKVEEKKTTTFIVWPLLLGLGLTLILWKKRAGAAQPATVYGMVSDATNPDILINGIQVSLNGYADTTKLDGTYEITGITPRTYAAITFIDPKGRYNSKTVEVL
jgi:hypothetical protein